MPDFIRVSSAGPIRTITLARPEARNALNYQMLDEMLDAFRAEPPDDERVVVLRAEGPAFCAGMDLKERLANPPPGNDSPIEVMLAAIEDYPLPVVAIVHGDAIAGGNELALHCDFVVASTKASFGMSLAQIGLAPTWFLLEKLMEVAGPVVTREVLLLGDPLPATRMHELGVISRVAPPHALESTAQAVIERLAANAPLSLRAMKANIVRQLQYRENIPHEDVDRLVDAARKSSDAVEGVAARVERRQPQFSGS